MIQTYTWQTRDAEFDLGPNQEAEIHSRYKPSHHPGTNEVLTLRKESTTVTMHNSFCIKNLITAQVNMALTLHQRSFTL